MGSQFGASRKESGSSRKKMRLNSSLEEEITTGLQEEIEITRKKLRSARKKMRSSRKKPLRAWEEIT